MNKNFKIYGILFLVIAILAVISQLSKKEIIDWRKNFDLNSKTPFGLYVFNKEVNQLLKNKVEKSLKSGSSYYYENPKLGNHNILVVNREISKTSADKIMLDVKAGSDALIFSEDFSKNIQSQLGFLTTNVNDGDKNVLLLTDTKYKNDSIILDKFPSVNGFYDLDKSHDILGKSDINKYELSANFIKINYGKGHLYLHTEPLILTNYYLLKPVNKKYLEDVFSYLPDQKTVWFVDSKTEETRVKPSPLSFIYANPPLKYAWLLLWFGLILFVIFNAKRKQRIVPVIEPLENKSVEFIKSIGNLYLQEGDFHDMMAKKSQYFLHRIRLELMIDTKDLDENFAKKIHLKTGKNLDKINEAIILIKKSMDPYSSVIKEDLLKLNKILDEILPQ